MLLTFSWIHANPTEPSPALCALDLGAPSTHKSDSDSTLAIWTPLAAVFHIELIEFSLVQFISLCDLSHQITVLSDQINPVDEASLVRMYMLLAVQAEVMLTVLAPTCVILYIDHSDTTTCGEWAPCHIIHRLNCTLQTILLIALHDRAIEPDSLDIMIDKALAA